MTMSMREACPPCGSQLFKKNGHIHNGKQNHQCKRGGRQFVVDATNRDANSRIRLACLLSPEETYDPEYYVEQARRAAATVLEPLLGGKLEQLLNQSKSF